MFLCCIFSLTYLFQAHISLKNERDYTIQNLFSKHNLGSLSDPPFGNEVALNLTNRIKSRLTGLEKDMQHKKVNYLLFVSFSFVDMDMYIYICACLVLLNGLFCTGTISVTSFQ